MSEKRNNDDAIMRQAKKEAIRKLHIPSTVSNVFSVIKKDDCIVLSSKKK